ncbi:hypothetical protein ACF065_19945 [Streptomyces sp. NPDC015232]|uniref:hypothetical protein n=1 Tax=unclassified Streptomyces TaxID=2593676 RepID=UPI0036FB38EA
MATTDISDEYGTHARAPGRHAERALPPRRMAYLRPENGDREWLVSPSTVSRLEA